jgi:hypothetical protein
MQPAILIYSNCQGHALASLLRRHPALQGWDFVILRAWLNDMPAAADLARCHLLIQQPSWGEPPFAEQLPAHARRLMVPLLSCSVLWPYAFDRPSEPVGWRFPYGDRFLQAQVKAGATADAAAEAYLGLDLPARVQLDRLLALEVQRWQQDDTKCGTLMAPFLERELLRQPLFFTPDHPTDRLLLELANQVLMRLGLAPFGAPDWEQHQHQLSGVEVPVHPGIVGHFGLPYVAPQKSWRLYGGWLSLDTRSTYRAYAAALQRPLPADGLQEALDAVSAGQFEVALNICGLIRIREPQHAAALSVLATIQALLGRRSEAADLLRQAYAPAASGPQKDSS